MNEVDDNVENGSILPATKCLYLSYDGNFQLEGKSIVLKCERINDTKFDIILDETIFHPQGGGQPSDLGKIVFEEESSSTMIALTVDNVQIERSTGLVHHYASVDGSEVSENSLKAGAVVDMYVDAPTRRINSECHTAGHVVDVAMARCKINFPPTKGYHFADGSYVEYRGSIQPSERGRLLEMLKMAFSLLIEEDIETKIEVMEKDLADETCNRLAQNFEFDGYGDNEEIRIVEVAGSSCPCGGTHTKSTGDLQERGWKITGIKCKKGFTRIKYGWS
eukprot:CAMPEP_0116064004 /NCGR_PEP_ID=MMETSP0322-20121206/8810_1 /TAXON_ID=163516 /ORGANISM="Leptocylindrus danicus var. apora, Strain B651" /LENGTH=277 /DNA_ID=CAMNT_0003549847 /DNA_START=144 /DNA_END=977 /DNA_ORIENTATION=-